VITHYLGQQEVRAYLADLVERLQALPSGIPPVWLPIGLSGSVLADQLADVASTDEDAVTVVQASFDRPTKQVGLDDADALVGKLVIVLDSAIHSGSTMLAVVREAYARGATAVVSYSLVVKRNTEFVPTYWGVTIGDFDRAYFLLEKIPNNRLRSLAVGTYLRQLRKEDLATVGPVSSGVPAMDAVTWEDRWWDMQCSARERITYLLYVGTEVGGYLTYSASSSTVTVDEVVVRDDLAKKNSGAEGLKLGGLMMRWVETMARQTRATEMNLWAIEDKVAMYEYFKYTKLTTVDPLPLDGKLYYFMRKPIVYNVSPMRIEQEIL
jgi:hypoxanthine-guanine phosphoribosyltransferase